MDPLLWFRVAIAQTISIYMDGTDTGRQTVKIKAERIEIEIMMGNVPTNQKKVAGGVLDGEKIEIRVGADI